MPASNLPSALVGLLVIVAIGLVVLKNPDGFFGFCDKFLQLKKSDVLQIPFGALLFIVFWFSMERFFWKPYLAVLAERDSKTGGAKERARAAISETEKLRIDFEQQLMDARVIASREKLAVLADARKRAQAIIDRATEESQSYISKQREAAAHLADEIRRQVLSEVEGMSDQVVRKVTTPPKVYSDGR